MPEDTPPLQNLIEFDDRSSCADLVLHAIGESLHTILLCAGNVRACAYGCWEQLWITAWGTIGKSGTHVGHATQW